MTEADALITKRQRSKERMPLSHNWLYTFVSQEISKLTACAPQSLATDFPEANQGLNRLVVRRLVPNPVAEDHATLAFILARRAEAALDEWELACVAAQNVRTLSGYFKMLRHLENCIAALWQGLDFGINGKLFIQGDGSFYERLNWLYNKGRHFNPEELQQSGDLHRLWISNDGLHSQDHAVTFTELSDAIKFLADIMRMALAGGARE
jgi:hypothetical protein